MKSKKDIECWKCGKRGHLGSRCRDYGGADKASGKRRSGRESARRTASGERSASDSGSDRDHEIDRDEFYRRVKEMEKADMRNENAKMVRKVNEQEQEERMKHYQVWSVYH